MPVHNLKIATILLLVGVSQQAMAQLIPPQTVISQRASNSPPNDHLGTGSDYQGTEIEILSPTNYSPSNRTLHIRTTIKLSRAPAPPYDEEYLQLEFDGGSPLKINIANECTRSADFKTLTCQFMRQMPVAEASKDAVNVNARYYAWNTNQPLLSPLYPNWQAHSQNMARKRLYCEGYINQTGCTSGNGNNSTPLCNDETAPILPTTTNNNGEFIFNIPQDEVCPTEFWFDPPVSSGYDYEITGAKFKSVTMPSFASVPDPDFYFVQFPGQGIPAMQMQPGQTRAMPQQVSKFQIAHITPTPPVDQSDPMAFPLGIEVTTPTGPVTIKQKPFTSPPPPPPPGLLGDTVRIMHMNNPNFAHDRVVKSGVEMEDFGPFPFGPASSAPGHKRWNIDLSAAKIRIDMIHDPAGGDAGYGNGHIFNFTDLNPKIHNCSGTPVVTGAVTTTSKGDAPHVISGTTFSDHQVNIPLAPPSGVYSWPTGAWVETELTYGCRVNGVLQMSVTPGSSNGNGTGNNRIRLPPPRSRNRLPARQGGKLRPRNPNN